MRRRDFLAAGLAAAASHGALTQGAVAQATPQGPFTPMRQNRFIDAHCHLFNVLDVPAESFIKKVVLPDVARSMATSRDYATLFNNHKEAFAVMLHMLAVAVSKKACEPDDEIWVIDEMERGGARPRNKETVELALLSDILDEVWWPKKIHTGLKLGDTFISFAALEEIKFLLRKEAYPLRPIGELRGAQADELSDCREVARLLYTQIDGPFSNTIRWGLLFTRYRFQLADELHRLHGGRTKLITPALVDFSAWLGATAGALDRSAPMRQQVDVMARISRRRSGPRVHGFVAFDPLRQALFRLRGGPPADEPLAIVKQAVEDSGFIGVKLYPPMGFRPTDNAALGDAFPAHVRNAREGLGADAGRKLDAALDQLYAWCAQHDVPVMAHAANSYGSAPDYGLRADPAGWVKVLAKYPTLRLNMAHFGGFNRGGSREHPERSWGWTIGKMLASASTPHVYADISSFAEVLQRAPEQRRYIAWLFRKFIEQFPAAPQRLVYGSDWTMAGYADNFPSLATPAHRNDRLYPDIVADFLRRDLGFGAEEIDAVMYRNAVRFMGLGADQRAQGTRSRLEQFYLRAGLSSAWMQELDQV